MFLFSCLFKLFKFKPEKIDFEDVFCENNPDHIMDNLGLFTFNKRIIDIHMIFAHLILNYENSPPMLKEIIKLPDNSTYYSPYKI